MGFPAWYLVLQIAKEELGETNRDLGQTLANLVGMESANKLCESHWCLILRIAKATLKATLKALFTCQNDFQASRDTLTISSDSRLG